MDRDKLIEKLAQTALDSADLDALMEFFYDSQVSFLESLGNADLKEYAKEYADLEIDIE